MILFLKEHMAWLGFYVLALVISNLILYLDVGFSQVSLLYFNVVQISLLVLFCLIRFWKQCQQVKMLKEATTVDEWQKQNLSALQLLFMKNFIEELSAKTGEVQNLHVQRQEDRDQLLAFVHEMKAPLTAMKLMIESVAERKKRMQLERQWLRIYLLLDQQLHLTRLDALEQDNRLEKVQFKTIVVKEIRDFQSLCMQKGIGFDLENIEQIVVSDAKWLGFIIRQILSNAIKYSSEQSIINFNTRRDGKGHVYLDIQDTGKGIRAEDLPRIFSKSYTGTVGRESSAATGMGLYLAKNASTKLGIQLSVTSIVGEGTTMTLQFPLENEYTKSYGM